jgi:hypothetical protein
MIKILVAAALALSAVLCLALLATGADLLSASLPGGLPAGNALAWFGLINASAAALLFAANGLFTRALARVALVLSIAWLPASVLLAGNLALNFSGELGRYWLVASAGLLALVVVTLFVASLGAILRRLKRVAAAKPIIQEDRRVYTRLIQPFAEGRRTHSSVQLHARLGGLLGETSGNEARAEARLPSCRPECA